MLRPWYEEMLDEPIEVQQQMLRANLEAYFKLYSDHCDDAFCNRRGLLSWQRDAARAYYRDALIHAAELITK